MKSNIATIFSKGLSSSGIFILSVLIGRMYGPDALGQFTYFISAVVLLSIFPKRGYENAIIKHISRIDESNSKEAFNIYVKILIKSFFVAIILLVVLYVLYVSDFFVLKKVLDLLCSLYFYVVILLLVVLTMNASFLISRNRPYYGVLLNHGGASFVSVALIMFTHLVGLEFNVDKYDVIKLFTTALVILVLVSLVLIRGFSNSLNPVVSVKPENIGVSNRGINQNIVGSINYDSWGFLLLSGSVIIFQTGVFLVGGSVLTDNQLGVFRASDRVAASIALIGSFIYPIVAPKLSLMYAKGRKDEIDLYINRAVKYLLMVGVTMFLVVVVFKTALINVFGKGFSEGESYVVFLSIGYLVSMVTTPYETFVLMSDKSKSLKIFYLSLAMLTLMVCIPIGTKYGVFGLVSFLSLSLFLKGMFSFIIYKKYHGLMIQNEV